MSWLNKCSCQLLALVKIDLPELFAAHRCLAVYGLSVFTQHVRVYFYLLNTVTAALKVLMGVVVRLETKSVCQ